MAEPCVQGERLATLEHQNVVINDTLKRLEDKLDAITDKLARVPVLETNHGHQSSAMERAFTTIAKLEQKHVGYDKYIYMSIGAAAAVSILWSVFGFALNAQMTEMIKTSEAMKVHIAQEKWVMDKFNDEKDKKR